ncbi:kynurenine 3-monooxygenase [Plakobranchus ocellatus]|uniref:Kynurenine 3-monooxygenase n=1 Tax=Plakobranchus ocellatus TaxID=259542 RepID=A0AAV4BDE4_9GAST|nr:kynurenine 3-monooxygenase [Plakobranchus ocellatus]
MPETKKHVAICGGGLVGAMMACYLAKRGYKVDIYEMRPDIRLMDVVRGRSINLALSCRGREALKGVGLEAEIVKNVIPMRARMIHDLNGKRRPIPYGTKDQYIMSIDRRNLNELLLSAAEEYPDVRMFFSHKLISCDFHKGEAEFRNEKGDNIRTQVDFIIGTDGAFSAVRQQMMKLKLFDYQQVYIPHGYMELNIPPNNNNEFAMEANYLHIWPRNEFMMIALPNLDRSFTATLFMPFDMFESLDTEEKVMDFFKEKFPDSIELIGAEELTKTYMSSKALPMVSIKCKPYHVGNKCVILGDAAHAIVPFYGQGMNCGLEDCIVLNELLDSYNDDLTQALPEYTRMRHPDATAISDLAMYNYIEMRSHVNSTMFLLRKQLDNILHKLFPQTWVPLYTMVSFTRTRYHECISHRQWQDKIVNRGITITTIGAGLGVAFGLYWLHKSGAVNSIGNLMKSARLIEGLADWLKAGKSLEAIEATKDRKKWRTMIANAVKQGT